MRQAGSLSTTQHTCPLPFLPTPAYHPTLHTGAALRFTLAAAAFTPFLGAGLSNPATRKAGVELGVWSAAGYLTQAMALGLTDASR